MNDNKSLPDAPNSPIKNAPEQIDGHNFNPKQRIQYSDASYTVHSTRNIDPKVADVSPETAARSAQSRALYRSLNLSRGEYVISFVRRHSIGIVTQVISAILIIVVLIAAMIFYPSLAGEGQVGIALSDNMIDMVLVGLMILTLLGGYIGIWVYRRNVLFLTNESIIQEIQVSLFAREEQTVSLGSIEDARYEQSGIIQMIFNYGTIKLSIEGDEREYTFAYTPHPKTSVDTISNAIESFKNGRPVEG